MLAVFSRRAHDLSCLVGVSALMSVLACGRGAAKDALDAYREALERREAARLWGLSSPAVRARHSVEEIAREMERSPEAVQDASARMRAVDIDHASLVVATDGGSRPIVFVPENGQYRIEGGFEPPLADTPERALRTLLRGVAARDADAVRAVIPAERLERFAIDAALWRHLDPLRDRLQRARAVLGDVPDNLAKIKDDRAVIPYGPGLEVELVRQSDTWRVLDVD